MPVVTSNSSAAWSRKNSKALRRSIRLRPWAIEALELDRLDLGAVLLGLAAALRLLVGVELALDAVDLAVEQVDERPQQVGEIVLEPRVGQHGDESIDHGVELRLDGFGLGQRARVGLVLAGTVAVKRELVEQIRGRRSGVRFVVGFGVGRRERMLSSRVMAVPFCRGSGRALRGLHGDPLAGGGAGLHPQGRSAAEDGAGRPFCFAMQSRA